jgi:DNA-binding SARP family transcriptional activator/TolB-like protein
MIRLRTLGALDLRSSEGQELRAVLAQPKRAALLVYLALAPPRGPHRRDTLLALFWPEHDAEHARNALSQAVHFLRRSLGPEALAAANGDGLGLEWKDFWCDAAAFEEALDDGRLPDALDLYRGDLLEGFHVVDAPEFDRWLDAERARLADRHAEALKAVAQELETAGDYEAAVRLWRRLASHDLYNSAVALRLMRALMAAGDPAGAIQLSRIHETLLREDLSVAPNPEIATLVRQLQAVRSDEQRPPLSDQALVSAEPSLTGEPSQPGASDGESVRPGYLKLPRQRAALIGGLVTLLLSAGGAVALRNGAGDSGSPAIRSLAVLPLESLSGDSVQRSFADGMHDALITELARYPQLRVISRTSVMHYKGTSKRLPEIARELKVDGVIEGTLLREGGRIRMNAQLVHGPSDRHLWAKSYSRDLRDVLLLQTELAEAIAREVRIATTPKERIARRPQGPPDSLPKELYLRELYLRGRHAEQSRNLVGLQTAKAYYRRAIEQDSTFALAYAGLAGAYGILASNGYAPVLPTLDSSRMMARRGMALDSTLSETHMALAVTLGDAGEFAAAEREFRRAIELGPSDARAHYWYGVLLVALGRGAEALREVERSAELDPLTPRGVTSMRRYAAYLLTGELPHLKLPAGTRWSAVLKWEPGEPWARKANALDLAVAGKCDEARSEITRAEQVAPDNLTMLAGVAMVRWYCGDEKGARGLLAQLKQRPDAREHGRWIAIPHAVFGEPDSAFVWLERNRWTMAQLTDLRAIRWLEPLRADPRFLRLLRTLGVR